MAQSTIVVYELTGTNRRFIVPFEYLARRFVKVALLGNTRTELVLNSDYRFIGLNEIETTAFHGGADGYDTIEIRRETSATDRLVEFSDGSVLRSRDMNVSAIQTIHIAEEARNLASDTLATDDDGNLDARGRRLVNLGGAVEPKDAMTYEQVTGWSNSALNQANRSQTEANKSAASAAAALVSQNSATASQSAAKTSETNSKTSETNSKASEVAAKTSETNSKASEVAAKTSETNSKASEVAAKTSETNAKSSEVLSQKWAENPVHEPVVSGEFSAKHWAKQAEGFVGGENFLQVQNNLSDLSDVNVALENLGLTPEMVRNLSTPVGMCYTQYPDTPAPADLFGGAWKLLFNNEGVFFRTEGGGASGFEEGVQGDDIKSHTHSASTNSTGAHTHSLSGTAASAGAHVHTVRTGKNDTTGYHGNASSSGVPHIGKTGHETNLTGKIQSAGAHTHSISGTAASAGAHAHTVTVAASGGSETRPKNRTIRVWQRTS